MPALKEHIIHNGAWYAIGLAAAALVVAHDSRQDARHIMRVDWYDQQITEADEEIEKLTLYNELGSQGNTPARRQVILSIEHKKAKLQREKESLE